MHLKEKHPISQFARWLVVLLLLAEWAGIFFFHTHSTEEIVVLTSIELNGAPLPSEKLAAFITDEKIKAIKYALWGSALFTVSLFIFLLKNKLLLSHKIDFKQKYLKKLFSRFKNSVQILLKEEKRLFWSVTSIFVAFKIYLSFELPLHIDEAFSHVFMVSRGVLATLAYYPGPNNHVGFLVIVALFGKVLPPLVALRLPALLFHVASWLVGFSVGKKWFGFSGALAANVLFHFSFSAMYYQSFGRGYAQQIFFFIVLLFFLSEILHKKKQAFLPFTLVAAWGLWGIPTFVYPLFSLWLVGWVWAEDRMYYFQKSVFVGLAVALFTLLLYSPILLISGPGAIVGNSWVQSLTTEELLQKLPAFLLEIHSEIPADVDVLVVLSVIAHIGWFYFLFTGNKKQKKWAATFLIFSLAPLLFVLLQHVLPFKRIWLYRLWPDAAGMVWLIGQINFHQKTDVETAFFKKRTHPLLLVFPLLMVAVFLEQYLPIKHSEGNVYRYLPAFLVTFREEKPSSVWSNQDTYQVMCRYEGLRFASPPKVETERSQRNAHPWQWIVWKKGVPLPVDTACYSLIFEDRFVKVFAQKSTEVAPGAFLEKYK